MCWDRICSCILTPPRISYQAKAKVDGHPQYYTFSAQDMKHRANVNSDLFKISWAVEMD
jgi:hypothetical protein